MAPASSEDEADELLEVATALAAAGCAWWLLAGAVALYWAAGGTVGTWTLWGGSEHLSGAREQWLVSLLWIVGAVELALASLAAAVALRPARAGLAAVVNASAFLIGLTLVPYVAVDALVGGSRPSVRWIRSPRIGRRSPGTSSFGTRGGSSGWRCTAPERGSTGTPPTGGRRSRRRASDGPAPYGRANRSRGWQRSRTGIPPPRTA